MKIVIAPNALKGCLSAQQTADAIARGVQHADKDARIVKIPVADGGDGLLETLAIPLGAQWVEKTVSGPLGEPLQASFLWCDSKKLAVVEMASAAGLARLTPHQLDPMSASTFGVGELIAAALDLGARRIVLGIGGSATTDGGTGLATALGARFLDERGEALPGNAASLQHIRHIDLSGFSGRLREARVEVACDVDNPLLGDTGAARVYAPQKGASPAQVEQLELGLANLAARIWKDLKLEVRNLAGAGAAGGAGAGLVAFLNAELKPGAQLVLELLDVAAAMADADLVITAEGRLDEQTRFGKAPAAVALAAQSSGVPCIAIAGSVEPAAYALQDIGLQAAFSLCPGPISLDNALLHAAQLLTDSAEQVIRCFQAGRAQGGG